MSIIERAAGKIPSPNPAVNPAPSQNAKGQEEKCLIEASIERVEASFASRPVGNVERDSTVAQVSVSLAGEDGPPTLLSKYGAVNMSRLSQMGFLGPEGGRSRIAEEYRLIKRPLLVNAFGQGDTPRRPNGNMIMVTSSVPSEGKSFTAINLAISMATEMENWFRPWTFRS